MRRGSTFVIFIVCSGRWSLHRMPRHDTASNKARNFGYITKCSNGPLGRRTRRLQRSGLRNGAAAGNHVNDAISAALEYAKKLREHCSSLRPGVVEEHNAPTQSLKPLSYEFKLLIRRLRIPVACP